MFLMAGVIHGVENYRTTFWATIAFLCRYGHLGLNDAMAMPCLDTHYLCEAVGKLIGEENQRPNDD